MTCFNLSRNLKWFSAVDRARTPQVFRENYEQHRDLGLAKPSRSRVHESSESAAEGPRANAPAAGHGTRLRLGVHRWAPRVPARRLSHRRASNSCGELRSAG